MKTSTITAFLTLSTSVLALPSPSSLFTSIRRAATPQLLTNSVCSLEGVSLPSSTLPPVSDGLQLAHVAVGRGTQNYTCTGSSLNNSTASPKAVGAVATLFNVTCLMASPQQNLVVSDIPTWALGYDVPVASASAAADSMVNQLTSGHHYFTNDTTPFFNLDTSVHQYGTTAAAKDDSCNAPDDAPTGSNGEKAVAWLKLTGKVGEFKEIYRVWTAGGSPPETCENQPQQIDVQYSAVYMFYK